MAAAAAAAAQWTVRVRERAVQAEHLCDHARTLLRGAGALLVLPMGVADPQGGRARAELVGVELLNANSAFATAAAMMALADFLARRGAVADPTAPPTSTADIPDAHESERSALGMLREARVYAEAAYNAVERCGDYLLMAHDLLGDPDLPGVNGLVAEKRDAAHGHLVDAEDLAAVSAAYAYTALCFLSPQLD